MGANLEGWPPAARESGSPRKSKLPLIVCCDVVSDRVATLVHGPKENFSRPAIDPLFRSAARYFGAGVIGIILTGNLDDGTIGLHAIEAYGGTAVVQDPDTALAASMPASALKHVEIDYCVALEEVGSLLLELSEGPGGARQLPSPEFETESRLETEKESEMEDLDRIGERSGITAPNVVAAFGRSATPPRDDTAATSGTHTPNAR